jgi:hypothetical protein
VQFPKFQQIWAGEVSEREPELFVRSGLVNFVGVEKDLKSLPAVCGDRSAIYTEILRVG